MPYSHESSACETLDLAVICRTKLLSRENDMMTDFESKVCPFFHRPPAHPCPRIANHNMKLPLRVYLRCSDQPRKTRSGNNNDRRGVHRVLALELGFRIHDTLSSGRPSAPKTYNLISILSHRLTQVNPIQKAQLPETLFVDPKTFELQDHQAQDSPLG